MSTNTRQKLSVSDVIDIRREHANGATTVELGSRYNVDRRHISDIVNGERWASVPTDRTISGFTNYSVTADGRIYSNAKRDYIEQEIVGGQPQVRLSKTVKGVRTRKTVVVTDLVKKTFN